jgi:pyridoxine 4-dehydrogenase
MPPLVERQVSSIGYGLMSLTWRSQLPTNEEMVATFGMSATSITILSGTPDLLKEYLSANPADAHRVVYSIKGGLKPGQMMPDGRGQNIRRSVDECEDFG